MNASFFFFFWKRIHHLVNRCVVLFCSHLKVLMMQLIIFLRISLFIYDMVTFIRHIFTYMIIPYDLKNVVAS